MGGQIVFTTDPIGNANPFGNEVVKEFCLNSTELIGQYQAFRETALQLGWICLTVGFIIGLIAGYYYCRNKYGCSE